MLSAYDDWDDYLPLILMAYRASMFTKLGLPWCIFSRRLSNRIRGVGSKHPGTGFPLCPASVQKQKHYHDRNSKRREVEPGISPEGETV